MSLRYAASAYCSTGAIPPIAEMQAFFWISLLKGRVKMPLPPPHYHLLVKETARIKYGVDHSSYMSTLAKDIGAAPGLWELWYLYGLHVLVCYWSVCLRLRAVSFTYMFRIKASELLSLDFIVLLDHSRQTKSSPSLRPSCGIQ